MIEDFGIAKNDSEIAIYAGMVTSAFTFAEFSAVRLVYAMYTLFRLTQFSSRLYYGVDW